MNVAITVEDGRVVPCFAGVELWIVGPDQNINDRQVVTTSRNQPFSWAKVLAYRDISVLLCGGIDMFSWGYLRGNGVQIVSDCSGSASIVLEAWRRGSLVIPANIRNQTGRGRHRRRGGGNR